jgi:RNA polymerase sigma-70 factor (ECF subfamily)
LTATEENNLIAEARRGSVGAFERLYRIHSARIYGLCMRLAHNQADAQDATQETFVKAWRALSNFRGESAFSTWLHRIAFNESVRIRRKRATELRHLQLVHGDAATDEAQPSELEQLERAIATLPDRAREALVLNKIYGYTHAETAEFMNIAVGSSKAQVHRAIQLLRKTMPLPEDADAAAISPTSGKA